MMWLLICALPILVESTSGYIDIGRGFDYTTQYWPDVKTFEFTYKKETPKPDGRWYAAYEFAAGEHGGTHIDAPFHFNRNGWKVGDIPVDRLIVPAVFMDMSSEVKNNADFELKPNHIKIWEEEHGDIPENSVLLIRYGWGAYYTNRTKYFGFENPPKNMKMHFPGMATDTAEYIVKHRNFVGVGIDTPSVDAGKSGLMPAHTWLLGANIYVLENVDLEKELPDNDFTLIVMPMKITDGTGAPCRVVIMMNSGSTLVATALLMVVFITRFL